ncbi:hypothetical protein M9Y10_034081 [Tritrichomonas musculus]|uniref:RING-type domain-containing protein n=1 Tax=Tritrichomonas musculus TaxID=1915356 RepID=A0ABR2KDX3_9EUKA
MNQNHNDWNVEGAFARNYTMFGLLVVVLFCLLWLADIYDIIFIFILTLSVFFYIETKLSNNISKIMNEPDFEFPFNASGVIFQSLICIFSAIIMILVYVDYFNLTISLMNPLSFVVNYTKSIALTMVVFNFYLALKIILVGFRIASIFQVKRGLFAIFHRFAIFLRSLLITRKWIDFFSNSMHTKLIPIIISKDFSICKMFLISKSIFFAELIWDFDVVRYTFYTSYRKLFAPIQCKEDTNCDICHKPSLNQIKLDCGHIFCQQCIDEALHDRPFCPICNEPPVKDPTFAFFDGAISLAAVFCCF